MRLEPIIAFTVFSIVTTVTPGPNNVMLTATGANVGIRRGLPHLLGIALGFGLMQSLILGGVGTALLADPAFMRWLRIVGIAVLLLLAWRIATAGRAGNETRERPIGFCGAAAFQWINPKAWLICAGGLTFLQTDASPMPQAALFGAIFVITGIPCMLLWLGFGAAMQHLLRTDRALRAFNIVMGVLLVATVPLLV